MAVTGIVQVPGGAKPSYAQGYYARDNDAYLAWQEIAKERATFLAWLNEHVMNVT